MIGFGDIFKKSFLESYQNSGVALETIFINLFATILVGMFIYFIYKKVTRKAFYSKNFNITLVALAIITSGIIITIQTNVIVSLGMVGALSIVRFRTAIKDPLDLVFLFWSISAGIICGANQCFLAVILSLVLAVVLILLDLMPQIREQKILIVNLSDDNEGEVLHIVRDNVSWSQVKSQNIKNGCMDLLVEVKSKSYNGLMKNISNLPNVVSVSLISQEGEVTY